MGHEKEIEIGLVVYPGAQQAAVLGLADLFGIAARYAGPAGLALRVTYWRQHASGAAPVCDAAGTPHVLIVPPTLAEPLARAESAVLAGWLRERHAQGSMLASVCVGAFVLADTGLMAGRRLTTPQAYAAALRQRHPDLRVDADQPLVDDGDVITAGGLMHWPALGLRLVERFLGPDAMLKTARALLVDPPGGWQPAPGVFAPRLAHGDAAVLKAQHWLQATQAKDMALASLAQAAGLEERTFLRRFQKATGMTSTEYCQRLRVGRARELLASARLSIDRVAWEVGYADPGAFRKVFTRIAGMAPGEYRRRCEAEQGARAAIGHARKTGMPVFHVRHVATDPASPIFAPGTPNVDIQPAVAPRDGETVIVKHHVNAFRATDFGQRLEAAGVKALVIVGAMSHMCIEACARAAADMGHAVTVLHDACATLDLAFGGVTVPAAQVHAAAMASLEFGYATVRSTRDWVGGA